MDMDGMPDPIKRRKTDVVNDGEIPRRYFLLAGGGFLVLFGGAFGGIVWANLSDAQGNVRTDEETAALVELARQWKWTYKEQNAGAADRYEGVAPFPSVPRVERLERDDRAVPGADHTVLRVPGRGDRTFSGLTADSHEDDVLLRLLGRHPGYRPPHRDPPTVRPHRRLRRRLPGKLPPHRGHPAPLRSGGADHLVRGAAMWT